MKYIILIIFSFAFGVGFGQSVDSLKPNEYSQPANTIGKGSNTRKTDSVAIKAVWVKDSVYNAAQEAFSLKFDSAVNNLNPYFSFKNPVRQISEKKSWQGKETIFYSVLALLIFFALVKNAFSRYLNDIFRTFFRSSLKQRQLREHMIHMSFASLLFNLVFLFAGAMFINLLLQHFYPDERFNYWLYLLYGFIALTAIYLTKFTLLKIVGWLLNISEVTNIYIFIVFTTNKIIGILLLPLIVGLAFTGGVAYTSLLTLSLIMIGTLFAYRFYLSFINVHKMIKLNLFHFFIYLCALEIAPLLLINKVLLAFFAESY